MAKVNICRAITFYNNILPATEKKQKWKYCALGIVDGINVSDNLVKKNGSVLESIWKEKRRIKNELNGQ